VRFPLRKLVPTAIGFAVVGAVVYAFLPRPVAVDVASLTRGPLRVTVDEDGKTRIKDRYVVSSPLAGRLLRIELDPGDSLVAGQTLLAVIEPKDPELLDARTLAQAEARVKTCEAAHKQARPQVERAKAAVDLAEAERGRARSLAAQRAISTQELDNVETVYRTRAEEYRSAQFAEEIAQFELEQARAALLRTQPNPATPSNGWQFEIHAPISGRVLRVFRESATVVMPGESLLELGDPTDLEVEIDVLSADAVKVRPGAKVFLEHWGGERALLGSVRLVEPSAFTKVSALGVEEQRVNVIVDFVDPPDERGPLGDGFRVEARIVIWEQPDVLKAPMSALFRQGEEWAVFRREQGRARIATVRIGMRNSLEAEILEGLNVDDEVIVHPSDKVHDGVQVSIR
jgi:HlyD family secretion protein